MFQPKKIEEKPKDYKAIAFLKFGADTVSLKAPGEIYILCYKKNDSDHLNPNTSVEFFIFDSKKQIITYEDKVMGATFEWKSDDELIIYEQRGIIESPQDKGKVRYLLNIKTNEKKVWILLMMD
jgi:hypothetical protein